MAPKPPKGVVGGVDFPNKPNKDEPGGERISVSVHLDGNLSYKRDSVLHSKQGQKEVWKTDDGDLVKAERDRGVNEVASELLKDKNNRG